MKNAYILGIMGGIFGLMGGLFSVMFGTIFDSVGEHSTIALQGWIAVGASAIAIYAATQLKHRARRSGWILIISGIVGLVAISFFYILPTILLVIGGVSAIKSAKKKNGKSSLKPTEDNS